MSLCKDIVQRKVGCKIENLLVDPPILRTNLIPDENGVTDHDSTFCQDFKKPTIPEEKLTQKKVDFKNKKILLSTQHAGQVVDGFRNLGAYLWNTRKTDIGNQLYYVWSDGTIEDLLLKNRFKYSIHFENDGLDSQNSSYDARKVQVKIVGNFLGAKDKETQQTKDGYETFDSFSNNIKNNIKLNTPYLDAIFTIFVPFNKMDIQEFDIANSNQYKADWDFQYNFYNPEYEKSSKNPFIPVAILPNFYVWFSEIENSRGESTFQQNSINRFAQLINLDGGIRSTERKFGHFAPFASFDVRDTYEFEYFQTWGKTVGSISPQSTNKLKQWYNGTILTSEDIPFSQKMFERNGLFPMIVKFEFPNQNKIFTGDIVHNQSFLQSLEISNLMPSLMTHVLQNKAISLPESQDLTFAFKTSGTETKSNDAFSKVDVVRTQTATTQLAFKSNFHEQSTLFFNNRNEKNSVAQKEYNVWDISKWIELFNEFEQSSEKLEKSNAIQIFNTMEPDFATFLGSYPLKLKNSDEKAFQFFRTVMFLAFSGKLKKLIKDKNRKLSEIFAFARECHVEQLFFRIAKYDQSNTLLQNFYIANSSLQNTIKWIDSQVKYDENYRYDVFSYNIALGTEYHYENLSMATNNGIPTAQFVAKYIPKFLLAETLYYSFSGKMLDSPPIPPEIEFVSFIDVNDKVQINLRSNVGNSLELPIVLNQREQEYFDSLPDSLKEKDKIKFNNDDPITSYEVFRINFKPKTIQDFNKHGQIVQSKHGASAASVLQPITPNVQYYYMFRSVDIHSHRSNPSSIYAVEMVDDGGFSYLDVKVFEFAKQNVRENSKDAKKYIMLEPNFLQTELDFSNIDIVGKKAPDVFPKVGTQQNSILNKNYKMRITSKKTGKKIDVNFKYVHEHNGR